MKLTKKLMRALYKPFSRDPLSFFAMTIDYDGTMTWKIEDETLATTTVGGSGGPLSLSLKTRTLTTLATAINALPGYTAVVQPGVTGSTRALTLLDGINTPAASNGNHLFAYTSLVWAQMDAYARELQDAANSIVDMLRQMRLDLAEGEWSDFWLSQTIGGRRISGESDAELDTRIISTILRVKCNNTALENIVLEQTGVSVDIIDIDWFVDDEAIYTYGGEHWTPAMVTNSANARIYPAWVPDPAVLAAFGLLPLASGAPAYGLVQNKNPLLCAFAVVFHAPVGAALKRKVMDAVNKARAGGTVALAYRDDVNMLLTNTVDNNTNDPYYVCGPVGTAYAAWP